MSADGTAILYTNQAVGSTAEGAAIWQTAMVQQQSSMYSPVGLWMQRSQSGQERTRLHINKCWNKILCLTSVQWNIRIQKETHSAEPGHSQRDGCFEVIRTLLGQSCNKAGGCCYHSLKTVTHTPLNKNSDHLTHMM